MADDSFQASTTPAAPAAPEQLQNDMSPDQALAMLLDGNRRYLDDTISPSDYSAVMAAAVEEHAPIAGILGCADARVAAELIFDRGPGDLFMVRVAGNFLSEYGLASLEYAVRFLHTPLLMVLGHTECGAVNAALKSVRARAPLPGRLPFLIDAIEPAVHIAEATNPDDLLTASIIENVRRQVQRLSTISTVIIEAIDADDVKVVGAVYNLTTGKVALV